MCDLPHVFKSTVHHYLMRFFPINHVKKVTSKTLSYILRLMNCANCAYLKYVFICIILCYYITLTNYGGDVKYNKLIT